MANLALIGAAAVAALLLLANRRADLLAMAGEGGPVAVDIDPAQADELPADMATEEQGQGGGIWDQMGLTLRYIDPATYFASTPDPDMANQNRAAFLQTLRFAEGTAGGNGYRTLFGGQLFNSFADHPRIAVQFTDKKGRKLWTSAAGAYQFMAVSPIPGGSTKVDTWDRISAKLGLPDFSPESQDLAALELIRERGALDDVDAGRFADACAKCRPVWASLPGAGYDQPERTLTQLQAAYTAAGGALA